MRRSDHCDNVFAGHLPHTYSIVVSTTFLSRNQKYFIHHINAEAYAIVALLTK